MLIGCIFLSVLVSLLSISGWMPSGSIQRDLALIATPIIFMVWNVLVLRGCYSAMRGKKSYFIVNIWAYVIFAIINLSIFVFCSRTFYVWLFSITGFMRYSNLNISAPVSIALFHIILIASIFLAPIGMKWVKKREEEKMRYIEKMPPMLVIEQENKTDSKSDNIGGTSDEASKV